MMEKYECVANRDDGTATSDVRKKKLLLAALRCRYEGIDCSDGEDDFSSTSCESEDKVSEADSGFWEAPFWIRSLHEDHPPLPGLAEELQRLGLSGYLTEEQMRMGWRRKKHVPELHEWTHFRPDQLMMPLIVEFQPPTDALHERRMEERLRNEEMSRGEEEGAAEEEQETDDAFEKDGEDNGGDEDGNYDCGGTIHVDL